MSGQLIGALILWLIVAIIVIAIVVYLVNWLYRRSSKEVSFVRTGLFGERVVINGGAFVLPFIHDITPVNMNVLQMRVHRGKADALITRDRMRVDIDADFYVRVRATPEAVSLAAATLGRRTMEPETLHALLSGKFVSALRSVASEMTMEEMHEQRGDYLAGQGGGRRGAGAERPRTGIGGAHRSRPDRPAILQPVEPLRRRGLDAADRGDRGPAQNPQRHRAGFDDPDPHAQSRGREAGARHRARERARPAEPAARRRGAPRGAARRNRARARAARHRGRAGPDHFARGDREIAHRQRARHQRGAHRLRARRPPARDRAQPDRRGGRDRRTRDGREGADRQ